MSINELMSTIEELRETIHSVYIERNMLVSLAADFAVQLGYISGIRKDDNPDVGKEWKNVVYIDVPHKGKILQLSWHIHDSELPNFKKLPIYTPDWDKHTAQEKYKRIELYVR